MSDHLRLVFCKIINMKSQLLTFLFPSNYFKPKKPEPAYLEEFTCFSQAGFPTSVISLESLNSDKLSLILEPGSKVIYRGWMLSLKDYELLSNIIEKAGASLLTSKTDYVATHWLPNWYPLISDLTPETKFYSLEDDLESQLNQLSWNGFFIKDYVKSLKTSVGSIINKPEEIKTVIAQMQKFRGTIEGGICVRRLEDFVPETETRYFVLFNEPFSAFADEDIPDIVIECANRIKSKFFSVDIIERKDGTKRIVEIGDGQVCDLVGWTSERFVSIFESNRNYT